MPPLTLTVSSRIAGPLSIEKHPQKRSRRSWPRPSRIQRASPAPSVNRCRVAYFLARVEVDAKELEALQKGGVQKIYCDDDLTIINPNWAPRMSVMPHDHRMWAVIGIFGGQEDNIFYRRRRQTITQQNAKVLEQGDTIILGPQAIHSVSNPLDKITAAIHVYGGNFFTKPRSEWDPETLAEMPYDVEKTMRLFEEANSQQSPT